MPLTESSHATAYGYFDDAARAYVLTDPLPPRPWINYLGNRRLTAFISQNAGGLLWYVEPQSRRITRYHYLSAPADRPGFYLYVSDRARGTVWNPHFAPPCTPLDAFACRHAPGMTCFRGEKDGVAVEVPYAIPPAGRRDAVEGAGGQRRRADHRRADGQLPGVRPAGIHARGDRLVLSEEPARASL